jgi:hypothetical protein
VALNRYPSQRVEDLKTALQTYVDMPAGYSLMLGNGSDELISLLSLACQAPGAVALAPEPGFVMYALSTQLQGLTYVPVSLTADFELDEAAMSAAIDKHHPAIVYLAYPNNPSANLWDASIICRLIAQVSAYGGWVVLDEAYQPFSSLTWWDEIRRDPVANAQVLLMRTLSKFGLAGVRIGYMLGRSEVIAHIDKIRPPYNISVLNAECALFALEHQAVFQAQAQAINLLGIGQKCHRFKKLSFDSLQVRQMTPHLVKGLCNQVHIGIAQIMQTHRKTQVGFVMQFFGYGANAFGVTDLAVANVGCPWKAFGAISYFLLKHGQQVHVLIAIAQTRHPFCLQCIQYHFALKAKH